MSQRSTIMAGLFDSLGSYFLNQEIDAPTICRDDRDLTGMKSHETPAVMFVDLYDEDVVVEDDTARRMRGTIILRGFCLAANPTDLHVMLSDLRDNLIDWTDASFALPENVLKLQLVNSEDGRFDAKGVGNFALVCNVTYVLTKAVG